MYRGAAVVECRLFSPRSRGGRRLLINVDVPGLSKYIPGQ
jgi:hypothetical protein